SWSDGAAIEARWRGTDQDGAVAILNQLTWRDADHLAGFAAPADGAVTLVDESEPDQTSYAAELVYTDDAGSVGVGQGVQVQIHTSMADGSTRDVVEAEFLAGRVAGSDGSSSSYDDEFGTLRIAWPGWSAWIDANKTPVTEAQLRAVAATLTPTTEAQMRALELTTPGGELATEPPVTTTSAAPRPQDPALSLSEAPLQEPITSLEGGETTLAALADGRPMVVTLWATSCVPCIRMVQALDEIARSHPDAVVVAVAEQDAAADVEAFVAQAGVEVPILLDPDGALLAGWGRSAIPTTVVVGADGRVLGSMTGEASTVSDLEEIITQYLG
ncbi:MAG TPA: TlpA disulfide reductase family protein, partial [Acidimicrobiales bacterium]|nr:TlpA disulfide reductase family protein [Acidimicrobiales bacterium]